jgi:hypothetical protein
VAKPKRSLSLVAELLAEKSAVLSPAQALTAMGMGQSAPPLWASAAALEERIAPLLAAAGDDLEAAVHGLSAAGRSPLAATQLGVKRALNAPISGFSRASISAQRTRHATSHQPLPGDPTFSS